jgi:hypothetical protein
VAADDDFPDTVPLTRPRNENIVRIRRRLSDDELEYVAKQVESRIYLRAGRRFFAAVFGFLVRYGGAGFAALVAWEIAKALGLNPEPILRLLHLVEQ